MAGRLRALAGRLRRPAMPLVVGAPRSGTTLLRFMLDAHPLLAIPPETGFLLRAARLRGSGDELRRAFFETTVSFPEEAPAWEDYGIPVGAFAAALDAVRPFRVADGVRVFYRLYAARFGKPRWGDKTPVHALHVAEIAALLPEAHVIHVIRDGRDAALSLRPLWFSPGEEMSVLAAHWSRHVAAARSQGAECPHYREVRFEELVRDPRRVLGELCDYLGLRYDPAMERHHLTSPERLGEHRARRRRDGALVVSREQRLEQQRLSVRPPDPSRCFAWRRAMTAAEREQFESVAGPLLGELGYETLAARPAGRVPRSGGSDG